MTAEYELFAIRYASRPAMRHEHFIGGDPHDGPMPMDYFVWVAKNADRAVVIDIGFTATRFHLQEPEMHYAVGHHMKHRQLARSFEPDDVCGIVRLNFDGRVVYHNGPADILPGISIVPTGGHSVGLQFVKVNTARGVVVLASDVTHFYENFETYRPFTTAFHVGDMLDAFDTLRAHAADPSLIVPGHDPLVMQRYPAPSPELQGIVVRLDVPPKG